MGLAGVVGWTSAPSWKRLADRAGNRKEAVRLDLERAGSKLGPPRVRANASILRLPSFHTPLQLSMESLTSVSIPGRPGSLRVIFGFRGRQIDDSNLIRGLDFVFVF